MANLNPTFGLSIYVHTCGINVARRKHKYTQ
jgi:hypothetical protein